MHTANFGRSDVYVRRICGIESVSDVGALAGLGVGIVRFSYCHFQMDCGFLRQICREVMMDPIHRRTANCNRFRHPSRGNRIRSLLRGPRFDSQGRSRSDVVSVLG